MKRYVIFLTLSVSIILGACTTTGANVQTAYTDEAERTVETREVVSGRDTVGMDDDEMICRRRQVTGTRIRKLICRTWGEWQAIEEQSEKATIAIQQRRGQCAGDGCRQGPRSVRQGY